MVRAAASLRSSVRNASVSSVLTSRLRWGTLMATSRGAASHRGRDKRRRNPRRAGPRLQKRPSRFASRREQLPEPPLPPVASPVGRPPHAGSGSAVPPETQAKAQAKARRDRGIGLVLLATEIVRWLHGRL